MQSVAFKAIASHKSVKASPLPVSRNESEYAFIRLHPPGSKRAHLHSPFIGQFYCEQLNVRKGSPRIFHPPASMTPLLSLPTETLDTIFRFLPTSSLYSLLFVNRVLSTVAERLLYANIQHLQLFPRPKSDLHISLLLHLATQARVARHVRHLAVQGLPWQTDEMIHILSRALSNMIGLLSIELDLGSGPEELLFYPDAENNIPRTSLTRLQALNVVDAPTVAVLAPGRPIDTVRVGEPIDELDFIHTLSALTKTTVPVRQLQLSVTLASDQAAFAAIRSLVHYLPRLTLLSLYLRVPRQFIQDFTGFITELSLILSSLSELKCLGLALPPPTQSGDCAHVKIIHSYCASVNHLELQWTPWKKVGTEWTLDTSRPTHRLMRRNWVYAHAK